LVLVSENATGSGARVLAALPPGQLLQQCVERLRGEGHSIEIAGSASQAIGRVTAADWDLVILDFALAPDSSLGVLDAIKHARPATLVAMAGGGIDARTVRRAFRRGAYDVLLEPLPPGDLIELATRAIAVRAIGAERRRLGEDLDAERNRLRDLEQRLDKEDPFEPVAGTTPIMRRLIATLREVARSDATALLTGESGTGKGMLARAIHGGSLRRHRPFVEANCVVYSEGVLNSELFGHEKGAFTGAVKQKKGRFELADSGTIFLDEIGDISPATQLMLLRFLQERRFERVGGEQTLEVDVRVIAATNKNLQEGMERGSFRNDLFYRLNVIPIHIPPLRERVEDIPTLSMEFLERVSKKVGKTMRGFSSDAMEGMTRYSWPGNVRELENVIERAVVLSRGGEIGLDLLPEALQRQGIRIPATSSLMEGRFSFYETMERFESEIIRESLRRGNGVQRRAAALLGLKATTLNEKIKRLKIEYP